MSPMGCGHNPPRTQSPPDIIPPMVLTQETPSRVRVNFRVWVRAKLRVSVKVMIKALP